jgi:hypothetical protein
MPLFAPLEIIKAVPTVNLTREEHLPALAKVFIEFS